MGNLHPALVHIPIGILFLYSLAEWCRWGKFFQSTQWKTSKLFMLAVGMLGGMAAFSSGDALEELYGSDTLIETHAFFATTTLTLYGILFGAYLVWYICDRGYDTHIKNKHLKQVWQILHQLSRFLSSPLASVSLATIGLISLTITGALGGAIVRGPETDFLVSIVYNIFVQ